MTPDETAVVDALVRAAILSDDLRMPPWKGDPDPLAGHCYVVCESIVYALGRVDLWTMTTTHEGAPHWWIVDGRAAPGSSIVDPTGSQFRTPVPYWKGRAVPPRSSFVDPPSARSKTLLRRAFGPDWFDVLAPVRRAPAVTLWDTPATGQ